jgi:membrane-associated protease RseP (regulator of RpoE activity)
VVPGTPGARAGLQQGDVIVKVNGQPVTPDQTVSYLVANTPVGNRIPLEIIRGGKRATVTVQVAERPTEEQLARISGGGSGTQGDTGSAVTTPQRALGLSLSPLTPELARAANERSVELATRHRDLPRLADALELGALARAGADARAEDERVDAQLREAHPRRKRGFSAAT